MNKVAVQEHKTLFAQYEDEGREVLNMFFAAYDDTFAKGEALERKTAAYLFGVQGLPEWALKQAYLDFVQGRIERPAARRNRLPTAEEIAVCAVSHVKKEASRQMLLKAAADQRAELAKKEETPEEQARMKLRIAIWEKVRFIDEGSADLASVDGVPKLIEVAKKWGVPVPEEVQKQVRS